MLRQGKLKWSLGMQSQEHICTWAHQLIHLDPDPILLDSEKCIAKSRFFDEQITAIRGKHLSLSCALWFLSTVSILLVWTFENKFYLCVGSTLTQPKKKNILQIKRIDIPQHGDFEPGSPSTSAAMLAQGSSTTTLSSSAPASQSQYMRVEREKGLGSDT